MKTPRSLADSGHEKHSTPKIGDRTGSWISPDVIHPKSRIDSTAIELARQWCMACLKEEDCSNTFKSRVLIGNHGSGTTFLGHLRL